MQLYQNGVASNKVEGVVLQPVGKMRNECKTLFKEVHLNKIQHLLTKSQHNHLEKVFPSKEFIVWGVNDKGRTNNRYQMIKNNFVVWFYQKRKYFLRAKVVCCFNNEQLASALWLPSSDDSNYNNLYFCSVESMEELNLSVSAVNELLTGEAKDSPLRGLTVYTGDKAEALLGLL